MNNGKSNLAACKEACPAGVNIPLYIDFIKNGQFDEALSVIREKIPFPAVCGYACVHPCESKCARIQYDDPVSIRLLKRAAVDCSTGEISVTTSAALTGKKVAVVGAGPCGLTAAYYMASCGHSVTAYETMPEAGGMLRYAIPEYRLPNNILDREIAYIQNCGVEIILNTKITSPGELMDEGFDAVLITVGAWKAQKMDVEGENSSHVINGISFLQSVNSGNPPALGKKVVIVGGGNTAIDAARASIRLGAEVTVLYRRTLDEMPASHEEVEEAIKEGVNIKYLSVPVEIGKNYVQCVMMTLGSEDESGRPTPVKMEGSEFSIGCNTVIMAIGQSVESGNLSLDINVNGTIAINEKTFLTNQKGIFAAGDAVTGPSSIIEAIAHGKAASNSIDKFLGGTGLKELSFKGSEASSINDEVPWGTKRYDVKCLPLTERINGFELVELGYDRETAINEARRCLACDTRNFNIETNFHICKGCGYCREVCSLGVFDISDDFNSQGYRPVIVTKAEKCMGCLKCLYVCPDFAITVENLSSSA